MSEHTSEIDLLHLAITEQITEELALWIGVKAVCVQMETLFSVLWVIQLQARHFRFGADSTPVEQAVLRKLLKKTLKVVGDEYTNTFHAYTSSWETAVELTTRASAVSERT